MGTNILVSYAGAADAALNARLLALQLLQSASAPKGRVNQVIAWNVEKLRDTAFYAQNKAVLDRPRGGGFWLWKPFIIREALRSAGPDDVVVYWDVGKNKPHLFTRSIAPLVTWCRDHQGMLPGVPILTQKDWTKRDCFHLMECDAPEYWNAMQIQATFSLWSGPEAIEFVSEWLKWCMDRRCLTDDPNECGKPNLPGFREHRHDQSVLTNLCVKHGIAVLEPPPIPAGAWSKNINLWSELLAGPMPSDTSGPPEDAERQWIQRLLPTQFQGRQSWSIESIERICRGILNHHAKLPWAMFWLGMIGLRAGTTSEAAELLTEAMPKLHASFDVYCEAAAALEQAGRPADALKALAQALPIATPKQRAQIYLGLGALAVKSGDGAKAEVAFRRILTADLRSAPAWRSLFELLTQQARHVEALEAIRQAVRLAPGDPQSHSDLIRAMHSAPQVSDDELFAEHQAWTKRHATQSSRFGEYRNERVPGRRLRIGYVSPGFHHRAISAFLIPLLQRRHRESEVFCYAAGSNSSGNGILPSLVDGWRDVHHLDARKTADAIRDDRIDILVDLSGHAPMARLSTIALRPAPLQVTYLGNPGIIGFGLMDHCLTDPYLDPPGTLSNGHAARLIYLPKTWVCYAALEASYSNPESSTETGRGVTFGCLDDPTLVTAEAIRTWCRILREVPGSRLILRRNIDSAILHEAILEHGIQPCRVESLRHLSLQEPYFAALGSIDIGLNAFPRHGPLVNCDGCWMGVPHVTLAGTRRDTRVGVSLLSNLGLNDLIARDLDQYVQIAVNLANDRLRLNKLRHSMRHRLQASPVMAAENFSREIETAYRQMWERWCHGHE